MGRKREHIFIHWCKILLSSSPQSSILRSNTIQFVLLKSFSISFHCDRDSLVLFFMKQIAHVDFEAQVMYHLCTCRIVLVNAVQHKYTDTSFTKKLVIFTKTSDSLAQLWACVASLQWHLSTSSLPIYTNVTQPIQSTWCRTAMPHLEGSNDQDFALSSDKWRWCMSSLCAEVSCRQDIGKDVDPWVLLSWWQTYGLLVAWWRELWVAVPLTCSYVYPSQLHPGKDHGCKHPPVEIESKKPDFVLKGHWTSKTSIFLWAASYAGRTT